MQNDNKKQLTAKQACKLQMEQQVVWVKLLIIALKFKNADSKSYLLGREVDAHTLATAQQKLNMLDRQYKLYSNLETLPAYQRSNGIAGERSSVKTHYSANGSVVLTELADGSRGDAAQRHNSTLGVVKKQISIFNKHLKTNTMSTTKTASKKATAAKKTTVKKAGSASHITAADIRAAIDKAGKEKFNVAEYAAKNSNGDPAFYGRVYGCYRKHIGTMTADGHVVKAAKKSAKKAASKTAKKATAAA